MEAQHKLCPNCKDPWKSPDDHQLWCLPCGHIYGFSCSTIKRSTTDSYKVRCSHCRSIFKSEEIIKLYTLPDDSLLKKVEHLSTENVDLKLQNKHNEQKQKMLEGELAFSRALYRKETALEERDMLSRTLTGTGMLVKAVADQLKISHPSVGPESKPKDIAALQIEILDKLRKIELDAHTAQDRVVRLETEIAKQRLCFLKTGESLLPSQTRESRKRVASTSLEDSVEEGGKDYPINIDDY